MRNQGTWDKRDLLFYPNDHCTIGLLPVPRNSSPSPHFKHKRWRMLTLLKQKQQQKQRQVERERMAWRPDVDLGPCSCSAVACGTYHAGLTCSWWITRVSRTRHNSMWLWRVVGGLNALNKNLKLYCLHCCSVADLNLRPSHALSKKTPSVH